MRRPRQLGKEPFQNMVSIQIHWVHGIAGQAWPGPQCHGPNGFFLKPCSERIPFRVGLASAYVINIDITHVFFQCRVFKMRSTRTEGSTHKLVLCPSPSLSLSLLLSLSHFLSLSLSFSCYGAFHVTFLEWISEVERDLCITL